MKTKVTVMKSVEARVEVYVGKWGRREAIEKFIALRNKQVPKGYRWWYYNAAIDLTTNSSYNAQCYYEESVENALEAEEKERKRYQ